MKYENELNWNFYIFIQGHCFRRSSASLLADAGADLISIKRHGGWKSSTVAEGYMDDSIEKKKRCTNLILQSEKRVLTSSQSPVMSAQTICTMSVSQTKSNTDNNNINAEPSSIETSDAIMNENLEKNLSEKYDISSVTEKVFNFKNISGGTFNFYLDKSWDK